jgi:predicted kinase
MPASGKSTWCLEEMRKNPGKYKRINKDLMRLMLDANVFSVSNEKFILDIRDRIVESSLLKDFDVIIDDTNFSNEHYERMCKIAEYIGDVRVWEKYFPVDYEEALKRNAGREGIAKVPDHVITSMYEKHVKGRSISVRDMYFAKKPVDFTDWKDISKKPAIVVDVDGTVALAHNRYIFDMSKILEDLPNEPICELVRMFKEKGYAIIIVSGREDFALEDTKLWLSTHNIPFDAIFMRATRDPRKDSIVKEEIYHRDIELIYNIKYIVDDRPQVVRMWRRILGKPVLQVNDLEF